MEYLLRSINVLLPILYLSSLVVYGFYFFKPDTGTRKVARGLLHLSVVMHLIFLLLITFAYLRPPMSNLMEAMSVVAFAVAAVYGVLEFRQKETSLGVFVLTFVFVFQALSSGFVTHQAISSGEVSNNRAVVIHVGTALVSYSALAISALFSAMYLLQYHNIKKRHFGLIYERFPSLNQLNQLGYHGALAGFVLLTFSILSGMAWAFINIDEFNKQLPKVIVVMLAWVIYGGLTSLRLFWNWQGPRLAYFSLVGFAITLISLWVAFHGVD